MKPTFKTSNQNQFSLFPFDFGSFVEENHPARIINQIIDMLDISNIMFTYKGGGTSSYHPRMLIKVIIFGYLNNLYSCRKIAKALKENVYFMWLSGQQSPDYRTINAFRGKRLKNEIDEIFKQIVLFLQAQGIVTLEEVFVDGTKIESVANRYTFVWRKSIEKYKEKLEEKINSVLADINQSIEKDDKEIKEEQTGQDRPCFNSEELSNKVEEINQKLKEQNAPKKVERKVEKLKKEFLPKLQEYEFHLNIMGERNSYSKTDHAATFMRMKEDHMKNGQLKPAYNVQLSTENNFITNYTAHQNPGDTTTYKKHLNTFHGRFDRYPKRSIADAGFGGLENYDFMEEREIKNFVKFNYFHKEQTKKFKTDISRVENLYYNEGNDYFICPMGQKMHPVSTAIRETKTGYKYEATIYKANNCNNCQLRGACHKQKGNREIEINKKLIKHKQEARKNLTSEEGKILRGRRNSEVEQTFGQLKWNKKFNRFLLKGLPKINVELGLLALAHNFQKLNIWLINNNMRFLNSLLESIIYLKNRLIMIIKRKQYLKCKNLTINWYSKIITLNLVKIKKAA